MGKTLSEDQKQQILCLLSSNKSSLLSVPGCISEKIIDWHQTLMIKLIGKDVEWRTKTANVVPTVFAQKFAFECSGLHFWEINDWHKKIMIKMIVKDVKMVKEKQKTANTVPTVFKKKFVFETFRPHFWENNCLTSNINDQIDLKRCWVKNENSKYCAHCLRTKVRF